MVSKFIKDSPEAHIQDLFYHQQQWAELVAIDDLYFSIKFHQPNPQFLEKLAVTSLPLIIKQHHHDPQKNASLASHIIVENTSKIKVFQANPYFMLCPQHRKHLPFIARIIMKSIMQQPFLIADIMEHHSDLYYASVPQSLQSFMQYHYQQMALWNLPIAETSSGASPPLLSYKNHHS